MIETILYLFVGVIAAVTLLVVEGYYDNETVDAEVGEYMSVGLLALLITAFWPIAVPIAVFAAVSWYATENMGRNP